MAVVADWCVKVNDMRRKNAELKHHNQQEDDVRVARCCCAPTFVVVEGGRADWWGARCIRESKEVAALPALH